MLGKIWDVALIKLNQKILTWESEDNKEGFLKIKIYFPKQSIQCKFWGKVEKIVLNIG